MMAALLRTGRPRRIDDYAATDEAHEVDIGAMAGVPVIVNGRYAETNILPTTNQFYRLKKQP